MPTTISRRIRRIGLLPSTKKTIKYTARVKDKETGEFHTQERTKEVPVRNRAELSPQEVEAEIQEIIESAQDRRVVMRTLLKSARTAHKARVKSLRGKK